jgi:hypothetical protein
MDGGYLRFCDDRFFPQNKVGVMIFGAKKQRVQFF